MVRQAATRACSFDDMTLPEQWGEAMLGGHFAHARDLALRMEAASLLRMLFAYPSEYDLAETYYRLAHLSQSVHLPLRTDLANLHAAIRLTGVQASDFSDDLHRKPDRLHRVFVEEEAEVMPYRRIQRSADEY
jgi:hypothetical protein